MARVKTVLVVDDEPRIVQLARDYLENAGFSVLTAGDGARPSTRSALAGQTSSSSTWGCPSWTASTSPARSAPSPLPRS